MLRAASGPTNSAIVHAALVILDRMVRAGCQLNGPMTAKAVAERHRRCSAKCHGGGTRPGGDQRELRIDLTHSWSMFDLAPSRSRRGPVERNMCDSRV